MGTCPKAPSTLAKVTVDGGETWKVGKEKDGGG